jgi:hypothetical protein
MSVTGAQAVARATRGKDGRARPERTPPRREAGKNFRAIGHRDRHDLAVELVASCEGTAVLTNALGNSS